MLKVLSGEIRAYLLSEEGREVTLYKVEADDVCVLSASCVLRHISFDTQMVVSRDCELLIVAAPAFKRIAETNLAVKCYVYEVTTRRFSQVMWSMQQILFEKLDARLARFLLQECDKNGKNTVYMTHEEIARQISSAREVVARMLKIFASDGLVDASKRGEIRIIDRRALQLLT
jgi:CRP/FNR family transcriptional regulator